MGDEIRRIVLEWVSYLREEKLWGNDDPLFPATRIVLGTTRQFEVSGLEREHWKSASPIRTIFREAFINAGLPYFHPHSFRNTLVGLGQSVCQSPEEFKAWSQNLGHEKVLTTFFSYGEVGCERQGEIIRGLSEPRFTTRTDCNDLAEAVARKLRETGDTVSASFYLMNQQIPQRESLRFFSVGREYQSNHGSQRKNTQKVLGRALQESGASNHQDDSRTVRA